MKIAVIGAGAIGSYVAGRLAQAGEEVLLVGRPTQVDAVKKNGLIMKGPQGQETVQLKAAQKLDARYDLVIFTTKTQDIEEAYDMNKDFLDDCLIMTTQNGVQADNLLSIHFDKEDMISSIVMFGATYIRPGEVVLNFPGDWIIGKPYTTNDYRLREVEALLRTSFSVVVSQNIMGMKWLKLFVNFNNCIPALIGKSMQETFADKDFCRLSVMLLKEGLNVVQNAKVEMESLPTFPVDRVLGLAKMPTEQAVEIIHKTLTNLSKEPLYGSILQSIMRKKSSEIDFINGEVVVMANNLRMESSANRKIVKLVHEVEESGKFFEPEFVKREFNLKG